MAVILETSIGQLTVDLYTTERPRCEFYRTGVGKVRLGSVCYPPHVHRRPTHSHAPGKVILHRWSQLTALTA